MGYCYCGGKYSEKEGYFHCSKCGSVYIKPKKIQKNLYTKEYQLRGPFIQFLYVKLLMRLQFIILYRLLKNKSVLDYGCGDGTFLKYLKTKGVRVTGYDPYYFSDRSVLEKKYDVVLLFHVIEHVDSPTILLKILKGLLKPGGILVISTPRADSLEFRLAGNKWFHFDPKYHKFIFSKSCLIKVANKLDLVFDKNLIFFDYLQTLGYSITKIRVIRILTGIAFGPLSLILRLFDISSVMNLVFRLK